MPLNRGNVLPPRSLFDLIHKMWDGYYKVDTKIVRETMRVVTPPLKDLEGVGSYIAKECENRPVYKLEKYVGGGESLFVFCCVVLRGCCSCEALGRPACASQVRSVRR
jgi:hypothetical protein